MDIPDGSLCRITSSYKDCINDCNLMIIENEQRKESEPMFKLTFIRDEGDESESQFVETSDEETSEDEEIYPRLPAKTFEKENVIDTKRDKYPEVDRNENEKRVRGTYNNKRYNKNHNRNPSNRRNAPGKNGKHYDKHSTSSMEEKNYSFNSNKRNFNNSDSRNIPYSNPISNAAIANINPWVTSPFMAVPRDFVYPVLPCYGNMLEPDRSALINSHPEKARTAGLLGDGPPGFQFSSKNQNNTFIREQNPLPPVTSEFPPNNQNNAYDHEQNIFPPVASEFHLNEQNHGYCHEQNSFHPVAPEFQLNDQNHGYGHEQNSFHPAASEFQSNNQNGNFDHNMPPPGASNFQLNNQRDNFRPVPQYSDFPRYPQNSQYGYPRFSQNNYPRPGPSATSGPRPSHRNYKSDKGHWPRRQRSKSWNAKQKERQNVRRNLQDHFDHPYRN